MQAKMTQIDCYFSVMSPYSYLAMPQLVRIAAQRGAGLRYVPLHFGSLAARMGSSVMVDASEARKVWYEQDLARQAAKLGLPITARPAFWPANSAPASYAIISAQNAVAQGVAGDLHGLVQGLCRAVWAEDRNIADEDVVRDVMAANGFDPAIADKGMFAAADIYARNLEDAAANGVFGVPFMIVGDQRFWGQDRLDDLDMYLAGA
jgi:2-hydroxychromene-2-carboxylate isomerase